MFSFLVSIRRHLRLRAYAWAEMIPHVRQRLNLHLDSRCSLSSSTCGNGPTAESTLCITTSTTVVLDEGVTSRLQHRCMRRGTPVDSVLLASLFLAATEFARLDKSDAIAPEKTDQDVSDTRQHQPGRDDPRPSSLGIRLQKALVLGVVCIVMTLLSGSVESKALRYFCSIYAVVAGGLAVNNATEELPGCMVLMATTAVIGDKAARPSLIPVRMVVDASRALWDVAEKHGHQAHGMAVSKSSFETFKQRTKSARTWWTSSRRARDAPQETDASGPFQLFGCIQLGRVIGDTRAQSTPDESLGEQSGIVTPEEVRDDLLSECNSAKTAETSAAVPRANHRRNTSSLSSHSLTNILALMGAKYTLVYSKDERVSGPAGECDDVRLPDTRCGVHDPSTRMVDTDGIANGIDAAVANWVDTGEVCRGVTGSAFANDGSRGLEILLVENRGQALSDRRASKWLLERAKAILVEEFASDAGCDDK